MIGNLLRVKDLLPTNGEDSSRARAYACAPHHLSIANTKKRRPRRPRETKKATTRSQRERERERETKKERSPAAGDDPHWPTLYCGLDVLWIPRTNYNVVKIQRVVVLSSFESAKEL